ncbi:MAG: Glycerol kinase [Gammaproteobacteria bacterium]|nr:Glycerol kinase [Gammaproteobacteria bacterium]
MSAYYILAIDQGTTSTRAILFDQDHHIIALDQQEFTQYFPQPGWVEHDAEEIWQTVLTTCQNAIAKSHVDPKLIVGLGISNQRETSILWEKSTGKVLGRAIVWQDRRTAEQCEKLKAENLTHWIQQKTGLLLDPYFSATKIRWMLDHLPGAQQKADNGELAFGTIESFLVWKLTAGKVHVTDVTNASRTLLMNISTRQWDQELLDLFKVPRALLPEIVSNAEKVGETDTGLLGIAIPITGMAGDQQAALVGQACIESGMLKTTLGTGAFLTLNTGKQLIYSSHQLLTTMGYDVKGDIAYVLEGSIFSAGAVLKWLRDELQLVQNVKETEALAQSLSGNDGVYLVPAFTGLGAPYWNPDVRGNLSGITRGTTKAHIVRAALESIAYQLRDVLDAMNKDVVDGIKEIRVDGGLTASAWLLQFIANLLNTPVLLTATQEASCYGASILAAIGAGCFPNLKSATQHWRAVRKFLPSFSAEERNSVYAGWLKAVHQLL